VPESDTSSCLSYPKKLSTGSLLKGNILCGRLTLWAQVQPFPYSVLGSIASFHSLITVIARNHKLGAWQTNLGMPHTSLLSTFQKSEFVCSQTVYLLPSLPQGHHPSILPAWTLTLDLIPLSAPPVFWAPNPHIQCLLRDNPGCVLNGRPWSTD
jgi:hypothetical protein